MKIFYNPTDGVYTSATDTPINEDDIVVPPRPPEKSTYHPETNSWTIDPVEPEIELAPDEISRRQFFQQLAVMEIITKTEALAALQNGTIPPPLQVIIDQLPTEDDKFNAQMLVIGAATFNRLHPLAEIVRQAMQWTAEQKDNFWREAAKL